MGGAGFPKWTQQSGRGGDWLGGNMAGNAGLETAVIRLAHVRPCHGACYEMNSIFQSL